MKSVLKSGRRNGNFFGFDSGCNVSEKHDHDIVYGAFLLNVNIPVAGLPIVKSSS